MGRLLRHPLVHFIAIGTSVFLVYGLLKGPSLDESRRIEVDAEQIERLAAMWAAQWKRPPTESELDGLIDRFIREEILYREALAMGLDRDDSVVRRRLAQKIELLADDLATRAEPLPEELERYLSENLERYQIPERRSFSHVYFSVDRRGDDAANAARRALEEIGNGDAPEGHGDGFMLERDYASRSKRELAELFGADFAEAVFELDPETWEGPLASSYGLHLVYVRDRSPSRTPELAEVSARVRTDLLSERRRDANEALVDALKQRYHIVVEGTVKR